jgi:hypothetical protein
MRVFIIIVFLVSISCAGYERLTQTRTPYNGNNLRLDGYYYQLGKQNDNGIYKDFVKGFTLNANGVYFKVLHGSIDPELDEKEWTIFFDDRVKYRVDNINYYLDRRPSWGVFTITNSSIVIQSWETAAGGGAYPTRTVEGTIVNDTTLHFHKLIGAYPNNKGLRKKVKAIDETYYFREFSPKPDSMNVHIH